MTQIYMEAEAIDDRLAQMGLEENRLAEIVRRGYLAFASCTPNDPPLYPGFSAWAAMVRALREYLLPQWARCDENNYSLVINPSGAMAIAVATGDDATGRTDASPTTKSSKGPSTIDAVASNQMQLELPYVFDAAPVPEVGDSLEEKRMTWILLVHRARGEVRCELSLPTSMGSDGRVDGWRERIILKAIPTDPELVEITPPQPVQPDISVDVKRRA